MKRIDTSKWKEFKVGELFNIKPTKAYKMPKHMLFDGGEYPVIANSAYNNGVVGTTTQAPTETGNMITFSDTVDANTIFYQDKPFVGYAHVQGLYPIGEYAKKWTKKSLQYFATSFRRTALTKGFDYGNKFRRDIAINLDIKLPCTSTGEPDWVFMEEYMTEVEKRAKERMNELNKKIEEPKKRIDTSKWKEFKVGYLIDKKGNKKGSGLFQIVNSRPYHKQDVIETSISEDSVNYITRSKFNNGLQYKVKKDEKFMINPSGTISFGAENADFFYQREPYITGNKMYYLDTQGLSDLTCKYLKTVLQATFTNNFSFSEGLIPEKIYNKTIKLPCTSTGEPDWVFMEEYMTEVEKRAKARIKEQSL